MKKFFTYFCYITVSALALMGIFDLVFFIWGGAGETLSYQFWILAKTWPIVPFVLGFIIGHLVWQYDPDYIKPTN
jgi:hypothetical protein